MADHEFGHHTNWWDSSSRASAAASSFGWPGDMPEIKSRGSMESVSVSGSSVILQGSDTTVGVGVGVGGGLVDPNLHMMGLGLSSQPMDWNQALQRGEKSEGGFRSMLEDHHNSTFQFSTSSMDSSGAVYGAPGTLLQGLFGSDQHHQNQNQNNQNHQTQQHQPHSFTSRPMNTNNNNNYQYNINPGNYGMINSGTNDWSKVPQFLRTSPPHSPLQFSNNAPFWNASAAAMPAVDVRPSFFPSSPAQFPTLNFDDHKATNKINDTFGQRGEMGSKSTVVAKKGSEPASKRPRKESSSPLPAFKVRKEKMGDRITALQQLVSPFGKTDTASVLSEAIEYIKFLHEQVNVLSTPYMKSGAPIQHQQNILDKCNKDLEGPNKQDLRSRGLCLVPVSSTFPVAHETAVDFWNPTFGGTFR